MKPTVLNYLVKAMPETTYSVSGLEFRIIQNCANRKITFAELYVGKVESTGG